MSVKYPLIPGVDDFAAEDTSQRTWAQWRRQYHQYTEEEAASGDGVGLCPARVQRLQNYLSSQRFRGLVLAAFRAYADPDVPGM